MRSTAQNRPALRIAVLISGGGTTLANLLQHIESGRLSSVSIVQVISSRSDAGGVQIARDARLPTIVAERRAFSNSLAFSAHLAGCLSSAHPDLVVMGGFLCHWAIPVAYVGRVLNIHPALLPAFGGAGMYGRFVHEAVLASGARESGCTVHVADDEYDHGSILAQRRVPVLAGDTAETLAARVGEAERELYPAAIQHIADEGIGWVVRASAAFASGRPLL